MTREVAVVGFAHAPARPTDRGNHQRRRDADALFRQSTPNWGSAKPTSDSGAPDPPDYLAGRAFSFISAIDSIGAVPPINESMSRWTRHGRSTRPTSKVLTGQVETALVYRFGKSPGTPPGAGAADRSVHRRPIGARRRVDGRPAGASRSGRRDVDAGADGPGGAGFLRRVAPRRLGRTRRQRRRPSGPAVLRGSICRHDIAPITDGASVIVLAADDRARASKARLDNGFRTPHRDTGDRGAGPDHIPPPRLRPGSRPAATPGRSTSPRCTPRSPTSS